MNPLKLNIANASPAVVAAMIRTEAALRAAAAEAPALREKLIADAEHSTVWAWLAANFLTQDTKFRTRLFRHVVALSYPCTSPVIIHGETGTGKELIANALHLGNVDQTNGAPLPFVAINCTSLPDYLMESELFGHKHGSFTGSTGDKVGLLAAAGYGTVFLDEIGDMPTMLQAKLLRALQTSRIRAVGSNTEVDIHCRFICATHRDLLALTDKWDTTNGREGFRPDLYWRLAVHCIHILPLRHRIGDVPWLARRLGVLDAQWIEQLNAEQLHGNYRELLARCERKKVQDMYGLNDLA